MDDIEKIIDTIDIPQMEYTVTKKRKSISHEVPEVELPKTKAEVLEEAKDRLKEKTTAASPAYKRQKKESEAAGPVAPKISDKKVIVGKQGEVKTVDLDDVTGKVVGASSAITRTKEKKNIVELKQSIEEKRKAIEPKWVGGADELIPFAWAHPLLDVKNPSKYYKAVFSSEVNKLPAPRDK